MLSGLTIHAAKPREKPLQTVDERGLYMLIKPNG